MLAVLPVLGVAAEHLRQEVRLARVACAGAIPRTVRVELRAAPLASLSPLGERTEPLSRARARLLRFDPADVRLRIFVRGASRSERRVRGRALVVRQSALDAALAERDEVGLVTVDAS